MRVYVKYSKEVRWQGQGCGQGKPRAGVWRRLAGWLAASGACSAVVVTLFRRG